jgi:Tol biopolymer transport system component
MLGEVVGIQAQATGAGRRTPPSYLWSPRGNVLLFILDSFASTGAFLYDLDNQQASPFISSEQFHHMTDFRFSPDGRKLVFVRFIQPGVTDLYSLPPSPEEKQ